MNAKVPITGERLARLAGADQRLSHSADWEDWQEMLGSLAGTEVDCHPMDRDYALRVHQQRLQLAELRNDTRLEELRTMVRSLETADDAVFCLALQRWNGYGFFMWLSEDTGRLVAFFRAPDQRERPG